MEKSLDQILNTIMHSSEILEEEMIDDSELRNLTSRQLYCIEKIKEMKNPTSSELAEKMNIARASISVMIERLVKNGFIFKVTSDSDRRIAHVHLTEKGEKAAVLHTDVHKRISAMLTADMTDSEKQILIVLLNKSINSLTTSTRLLKTKTIS